MPVTPNADVLITLTEFVTYMNAKGDSVVDATSDADAINQIINNMSSVAKQFCNTILKAQTVTAEMHRGNDLKILKLKNIWNISTVVITDTEAGAVIDSDEYIVGSRGRIYKKASAGKWADVGYPYLSITYSAGFSTIPDDLKIVCLKWGAKEWMASGGERIGVISRASGDGLSTTYDVRDIPSDIQLFLKNYRNRI